MSLEEANEIHCTTYRMEDLYFKTQHDSSFLPSFLSFWLVLNNSFVYHIAHVKVKSCFNPEGCPKNSKSTHFCLTGNIH